MLTSSGFLAAKLSEEDPLPGVVALLIGDLETRDFRQLRLVRVHAEDE